LKVTAGKKTSSLAVGYLGALVLAGAVGTGWAAISGQPGRAVLLGLGTLYLVPIIGLGVSARRHRSSSPWLVAVLVSTTLALLNVAAIGALAGSPVGWGFAVIAVALAVRIGWFAVTVVRSR
jgi:hypothetical protein